MRRARRTAWSAAKVTLVATSKVGVGPGVNTLDHRSSTKEPMIRKSDEDWDSFLFFVRVVPYPAGLGVGGLGVGSTIGPSDLGNIRRSTNNSTGAGRMTTRRRKLKSVQNGN